MLNFELDNHNNYINLEISIINFLFGIFFVEIINSVIILEHSEKNHKINLIYKPSFAREEE